MSYCRGPGTADVPVHAHTVADTVREVLVVGTVSAVHDDLPGSSVYRFAGDARTRRGQCRVLSPSFELEHALHFVSRTPEHERSAQIRLVSRDVAAAIDQENRPFANRLRSDRAVRQGGILADLHAGASSKPSCVCAEATRPAKSFCVMPSFSALYAAS